MNDILQNYLNDYWEHILKFSPTFATYIGDHRYDGMLDDLSEESLGARNRYFRDLLEKTEALDETSLNKENQLNCKLLRNTLRNHIQMFEFKTYVLPLDHMQGPHIDFPQIIEFHPFHARSDIDNYISRLKAFSLQIDQVIDLFEKGKKYKITAFKKIIDHVLLQVGTFTSLTPENSPLFTALQKIKDGFSNDEKEDIKESIRGAIESGVTPAYRRLHDYLSREYIHSCRDKEGLWSLPHGDDMYRFFVRYHTTTDLSPEEIHRTGRSEVSRIQGAIQKIISRIGFQGSISDIAGYMKSKRELYPGTGKEIIDAYRNILSRMDTCLPEFFGRLPKAAYDIREIEKYREQAAPAAYYYPPPRDFSRPGYFYANTYQPETRPKYEMEALSYHEAVPGHHLQIAIMQELEAIPEFRRHEGSTAFIEGWALYAEKLSKEMGFYQDDYSEYGRLSFELWRAVRLVVDTGLHFYKWNRDETIQYCKENTGLDDHEIEVEVDRYIAMPGQALAYKTGELKIMELREKAKNILGAEFSIREFHDRLLEQGALPLSILEDGMNAWMAEKGKI